MTDWLFRVLHIAPAIFLAGGVFFMWIALLPAMSTLNDEGRESLFAAVRGRWSKVVMISTALLLATGLYNAVQIIQRYDFEMGNTYHSLVLVKLLLAMGIFFITAVLGGRSGLAEKFRQRIQYWMTVNVALVIVLIAVASTMKVALRIPKVMNQGPNAIGASADATNTLSANVTTEAP